MLSSGAARSTSGERYEVRGGYLDLLGRRTGADSAANLSNMLPGAGSAYEPFWRVRSLSLLTGEDFPNKREVEIISGMASVERGGLFLDLGCSTGLYTREVARALGHTGDVIGVDISPSMLKEAAKRARALGISPSFVRADAKTLPFADSSFSGVLCGGSLNEFGDPARALRETRRILAPGGRLAIMGILHATTHNGRRLQRLLATGGVHFFDKDEITSMLDHAGLDPNPVETFGPVFFAGATRR